MTTSEKQKIANKHNAQKSTGPKTEQGKAIVKVNALKHGLLSKELLIDEENKNELEHLGKALRKELKPENSLELLLTEKLIADTWRLKRALRVEREMFDSDSKKTGFSSDEPQGLGKSIRDDLKYNDTYSKLVRYISSIERGFYKALHELQRIQNARKQGLSPNPAVVDVNVTNYD